MVTSPHSAHAEVEDIMAGAFDKIAGVPFAQYALALVRTQVYDPDSLEQVAVRLAGVEQKLKQMDDRLKLVELRVGLLLNEVVKITTINRLREYQRIRGEISLINKELQVRPATPEQFSVLEFRARQQADALMDSADFD